MGKKDHVEDEVIEETTEVASEETTLESDDRVADIKAAEPVEIEGLVQTSTEAKRQRANETAPSGARRDAAGALIIN